MLTHQTKPSVAHICQKKKKKKKAELVFLESVLGCFRNEKKWMPVTGCTVEKKENLLGQHRPRSRRGDSGLGGFRDTEVCEMVHVDNATGLL